jgi:hypothetical protein
LHICTAAAWMPSKASWECNNKTPVQTSGEPKMCDNLSMRHRCALLRNGEIHLQYITSFAM